MPNDFHKFFNLFLERKSFVKNIKLFNRMIKQFKSQVAAESSIKSGAEFFLDFSPIDTVRVLLFDRFPKKLMDITSETQRSIALYMPTGQDYEPFSTSIVISLRNLFDGMSIKDPFVYIKKHFPYELEDTMIHELSHAYEDIVSEVSDFTFSEDPDEHDEALSYYNNESELNAYLIQFVSDQIKNNKTIYLASVKGDINKVVSELVPLLVKQDVFRHSYGKNKQWLMKTLYTIVDNMLQNRI